MARLRSAAPILFWLALLFFESEFLAVRHYELRTALRAWLHLPLYHLCFASLAFGVLLQQLREPGSLWVPFRLSGPMLGLHVALFVAIALTLEQLASHPGGPLWAAILLAYALTWLAAGIPVRLWKSTLQQNWAWLLASVSLGALSLGIAHVSNWLWKPMAGGTFFLARLVLEGIYDDVISDPNDYRLGTTSFAANIEPGCSGYEGLGLILMFGLVFLWLRRRELEFPKALLLLPIGWAFNWFINGLRIAVLVILGTNVSPTVAMKGFHSQAGWLAFITTSSLLLVLVEHAGYFRLRETPRTEENAAEADSPVEYPLLPYLLPLLLLLLGMILSRAFSLAEWESLYPLRIVLAGAALWTFRSFWRFEGRAVSIGCGLAVYLLWAVLVPGKGAPHPEGEFAWIWTAFRLLGSSLVIPVVEELAFRAYLMRRLHSADFETLDPRQTGWLALLGSSGAFALLHSQSIAALLAGLAYGWLYRRTGRLSAPITAHAVTNLCVGAQVLLLGHWSLWS